MKKLFLGLVAALLFFAGCNKCHDSNDDIIGEWKRAQFYGNVSWGGPFEWHNGADGTAVIFKSNGEYWRGEAKAGRLLIGTYKVTNNKTIEVTGSGSSEPTESFTYELKNDQLTLKYNRSESVLEETFDR